MRKNSIMMVLYEILCLFVPLIITPYVSRVLGADGIGLYSYTYSIITYFVIVIQLGIKLYGRREIAKVNDNRSQFSKVFWELLYIEFAMFCIVTVVYVVFVLYFIKNDSYRIALAIQYIEIIVAVLDISWFYFGLEKFTAIVIRNVVVRIGEIIFILLFIHNHEDVFLYIVIMAGCNLLGVCSMWMGIRSQICIIHIQKQEIINQILPMLKLFIPVLSTTLFAVVDKTIIGSFINAKNVGYYENAYKIAKIPVVIVTALGNVAMPRVTKLIADGKENEGKAFLDKSMSLVMGATIAMAFGMYGVSDIFIPIYLGKDFLPAIPLFKVLSFMIIFIGWGNVLRTQYMLPKGYDTLYTKSVIYAALINIILSITLVFLQGAFGVAIASLVSEVVICAYSTFKLRKELNIKTLFRNNLPYLFSGIFMTMLVKSVGGVLDKSLNSAVLLFVQIIVGTVSFTSMIIIFEITVGRKVYVEEILRVKRILMSKIRL